MFDEPVSDLRFGAAIFGVALGVPAGIAALAELFNGHYPSMTAGLVLAAIGTVIAGHSERLLFDGEHLTFVKALLGIPYRSEKLPAADLEKLELSKKSGRYTSHTLVGTFRGGARRDLFTRGRHNKRELTGFAKQLKVPLEDSDG